MVQVGIALLLHFVFHLTYVTFESHYVSQHFTLPFPILFNYGLLSVHTTPDKFENEAIFPRLGLTCTLIRYENGAFRKLS